MSRRGALLLFAVASLVLLALVYPSRFMQDYARNVTSSTRFEHDTCAPNLDPFPLPPCDPNLISAVYIHYGSPIQSHGTLMKSIKSLRRSKFPGRIRVVIDEIAAKSLRSGISSFPKIVNKWQVESLPNLTGRELIPHSNKIRALQAWAFVNGTNISECTLFLDRDTYAHPEAPWSELFSTLQLHDVAIKKDCSVPLDNVPEYLSKWMPNTGVLALRNTQRMRNVLADWLDHYVPCNGTHAQSCTPGTDQYSFLQLVVKHAVRMYKLDDEWNCRCDYAAEHPLYTMTVQSTEPVPGVNGSERAVCGGINRCHILHGHFLTYFS